MKIGIIKETKTPIDNRVALSPKQVAELNKRFPQHEIVVQASDIRAFSDDEYRAEGVKVVDNLQDCDVLFGIKEAKIESLIPNKHYFFFGHIAKMQEYNRPLLQAFMQSTSLSATMNTSWTTTTSVFVPSAGGLAWWVSITPCAAMD